MKIAYRKKIVSNIPVLASVCFTRLGYCANYCVSQELFVKFMPRWKRKCYNIENNPKIIRQLNVNEGNLILTWNLG